MPSFLMYFARLALAPNNSGGFHPAGNQTHLVHRNRDATHRRFGIQGSSTSKIVQLINFSRYRDVEGKKRIQQILPTQEAYDAAAATNSPFDMKDFINGMVARWAALFLTRVAFRVLHRSTLEH